MQMACANDVYMFGRIFLATELYYTLERVLNLFLLDHGVHEKADVI